MANQHHLDLLTQGVTAWNAWRTAHPDTPVDLRGADLRQKNLRGIDLHEADLSGAYLNEAHLSSANFEGADLQGVHYR